jgi:hypothetical protein
MRLCILGHSGIGKSPFSKLFKIDGWDPLRVRWPPRNELDKKLCIKQEDYDLIVQNHKKAKPLYEGTKDSPNHLRIFKDCSFFTVRGKKQYLKHTKEAKNKKVSLRVEIYAPVLVEMIENRSKLGSAFHLKIEDLVVVLLNPTSESFISMKTASMPLCIAVQTAIAERSKMQGKSTDLPDILDRIQSIGEEITAWQQLLSLLPNKIECKNWPHFEYHYSTPCPCLANAQVELLKTRETFLKTVKEQMPQLETSILEIIRTEKEILALSEIV